MTMKVRRRRENVAILNFLLKSGCIDVWELWYGVLYHMEIGLKLVFILSTMNDQCYVSKVMEPHILPYIQQFEDLLSQQETAHPRGARNWFEGAHLNTVPLGPRYPNFS